MRGPSIVSNVLALAHQSVNVQMSSERSSAMWTASRVFCADCTLFSQPEFLPFPPIFEGLAFHIFIVPGWHFCIVHNHVISLCCMQ